MSIIFFYSNYCNNSLNIIEKIKSNTDIHFINIDKRAVRDNNTYILLNNNKELLMPPNLNRVPGLLLRNSGNKILFGNEIIKYFESMKKKDEEISNFSFNDINNSGVFSDNFSYLDQTSESLMAKGDGGLRQIRNNATLDYSDNIETPEENYISEKISEINVQKINNERDNEIKLNI
tara:strand:+ start:320 stop:850 length:531 start_codon:yes stop_codon:yes gene_type:complete